MRKIIILTMAFSLWFGTFAYAETSIKAEVDKASITTDELLTYKVTVVSSERKTPQPAFPKFSGFRIISTAQSAKISLIKSAFKTTMVFTFVLAAEDIGKLSIAPAVLKINNQDLSTDAFTIEVKQGKVSLPKDSRPQSEEPKVTL